MGGFLNMDFAENFVRETLHQLYASSKLYEYALPENVNEIADEVYSNFIIVDLCENKPTLPQASEFRVVTYNTDSASASSYKLKNIKFNLKKFLFSIAEGTLAIISSTSNTFVAIMTFLLAIRTASNSLLIPLKPDDAILLYSIAKFLSEKNHKSLNLREIAESSEKEFSKLGRPSISLEKIKESLRRLVDLGCLDSNSGNEYYLLVEKINF